MSEHTSTVIWRRDPAEVFTDNRYSRAHDWTFDGGVSVRASSSPHAVRVPLSDPSAVDPEEAFVASLSSCHMLCFLSLAATRGFVVEEYRDNAVGVLKKDEAGRLAITKVTLRPRITFSGDAPTADEIESLHHAAHDECFLANSVKTIVGWESGLDGR
ncbi:peroxiredoxin [Capsulimonas corticalis]|uniref:Peroxiredoxin n=1 Tax=Capsulimonas corticalis TaxID=2219043 RepID=A0A402CTD9_9BACT|nr:OsmC family protein [Capsulimonas corticalis]BDI30775.1 peroxiredoxin [Capsulimonas corticalis]